MRIFYLDNAGGGFADHIDIPEGTTIGELFRQRKPDAFPEDYKVRVNEKTVVLDASLSIGDRVEITPTTVLQPEDRVTVSPTKVDAGG